MAKKTKTLLLTMITTCLCVALVVGVTYALFSDSVTVKNHLQAGSLDIALMQTKYQEKALNEQGLLEEFPTETKNINLADDSDPIFEISNTAPGCWYKAEFTLANNGDIAFDCGVRIVNVASDNAKILKQIRITVFAGTEESGTAQASFMLEQWSEKDVALDRMLKGDPVQTFTVKAEFVNDESQEFDNDDAQNASLTFDVQVYAVQATEA